ncbi:dual specificity protein kinase YAK1 homolog isoform X3 [Magnolia sinica]|uniref:dual specificity protein kinase YAK1 homolog isoform X3 n=1 Tax=Magnolia sinica TaxID=86752 RepID=UPI002659264E|nr:dual specificity protein kinase YAK1 homolog isoform X3 [Magnolia sinica]
MDEAGISKEDEHPPREAAGHRFSKPSWNPCCRAFRPYSSLPPSPCSSTGTTRRSSSLRVIVKRPLVARLTKGIVETYQICNPAFKYSEDLNPKRFLTSPYVGVLNEGYDNENSDLILHVNFALVNLGSQQRYVVKDILGQGTFGQVAKCWVSETNSYVAVKIIKNQPAYYQQALVEVSILTTLNQKFDPEDKHHIVRILDYFVYQRHLCISFEMLGSNLYELIKMNQFRGLSLSIVQLFSKQILHALVVMKDAGIIHCDLKPENILLSTSVRPPEVKIIDFGSACMEDRTVYSYIQSRYYRSPEVLLGYPYTTAIDMWSFGCIVAELFLGLPLFPGASEFDLLRRMIRILGQQPPDHVLRLAKNTNKFFKHVASIHHFEDDEACNGGGSAYQVLTEEEYQVRESKEPVIGKWYFKCDKLDEIVATYPHRTNLTEEEISKEKLTRLALLDFLRGLVELDPVKRWSPLQAVRHPFVTGEPFTCPYIPAPETPRIPVSQNVMVDHNPGVGHWFVAGLSPQVARVNKCPQSSSHFQVAPFSQASSYGSLGSYGSYNESAGLGGSYGSYGDSNSLYMYYSSVGPSGLNLQTQGGGSILGSSPDARRRTSQLPHGNGFGASPSMGSPGTMSLGASPSQFTPPSSQMQVSAGSPGKYGPSSPARGTVHGSPLGKVAAVGQYNRRRSLGYPGSLCMQPQENPSSQHWPGHQADGISCSHPEGNSRGHVGSFRGVQLASNPSSWRQQRCGNGPSSGLSSAPVQNIPPSFTLGSQIGLSPSSEPYDKPECSSSPPDPGDWDPNYSEELLLEEDGSDVSSLTSGVTNGMRLSHGSESTTTTGGVGRFSRGYNPARTSSRSISTNQRTNGPVQYSHIEGSPPSVHDKHAGYGHPMSKPSYHMLHFSQNSPSRFGQQPLHRFNHVQSTFSHGERNHPKFQSTPPSYNAAVPHSPGRRTGHPNTAIPPSSHARKDYGRMT